jgi:hypothetical protein
MDKTYSAQAEHKELAVSRVLLLDFSGPVYKQKVVGRLEERTIHFSGYLHIC